MPGARAGDGHHLRIVRGKPVIAAKSLDVGHVDRRLPRDHQLLARSVDPRRVQRIDVVNRREIVGRDVMLAVRRGVIGMRRRARPRLHAEIGETADSGDRAAERRGDGRLRCVGEVRFAVHCIIVQLDLERRFDLRCIALERDRVAPARHAHHRQSLRLKPARNRVDVRLVHAESIRELLRRQPLMILRRTGSLLRLQKLIEIRLLGGSGREPQRHIGNCERRIDAALVEFRARSRT